MANNQHGNEEAGRMAGIGAGALAGASLGTSMIPVPVLGTFVGALVGGVLGSEVGRNVGAAVLDFFNEDASAPGSRGTDPDILPHLERLVQLKLQGLMTEEEFNAAKRRLLGL